jgi:glycosyltransferase involved in cell wall biosynthesis
MRVLHVSKTSEGAFWAVRQVSELVRQGIDVHVAVPSRSGAAIADWQATGARLHFVDFRLPANPATLVPRILSTRRLIHDVNPDLIHSHFVSTTVMLRVALGRHHGTPRIFQVPGPLHLEHWHTRTLEMSLAGEDDFWIGSSQFVLHSYEVAGVSRHRCFLSYYSADTDLYSCQRRGYLRRRLEIPSDAFVAGNINLLYPPKTYLGHKVGLKCHEDVIHAITLVRQKRPNVWGVLIGSTFGKNQHYESKLRELAYRLGSGKILMPGKFNAYEVAQSWPDFNCAVHVPFSENCGGVVEPLLSGIPTVASAVGGLPEVVHAGQTGEIVPVHRPDMLAKAIFDVIDHYDYYCSLAMRGKALTSVMFDPKRCTKEILSIYRHILYGEPRPGEFDPKDYLASIREQRGEGQDEVLTSSGTLAMR